MDVCAYERDGEGTGIKARHRENLGFGFHGGLVNKCLCLSKSCKV